MSKWKAKVVTALFMILLIVLAADVVAVIPKSLPWILGVFAIPGVIKFGRVLYIWLTTEDDVKIHLPHHKKAPWAWKKEEI